MPAFNHRPGRPPIPGISAPTQWDPAAFAVARYRPPFPFLRPLLGVGLFGLLWFAAMQCTPAPQRTLSATSSSASSPAGGVR